MHRKFEAGSGTGLGEPMQLGCLAEWGAWRMERRACGALVLEAAGILCQAPCSSLRFYKSWRVPYLEDFGAAARPRRPEIFPHRQSSKAASFCSRAPTPARGYGARRANQFVWTNQ